jgi:hypothetical protein
VDHSAPQSPSKAPSTQLEPRARSSPERLKCTRVANDHPKVDAILRPWWLPQLLSTCTRNGGWFLASGDEALNSRLGMEGGGRSPVPRFILLPVKSEYERIAGSGPESQRRVRRLYYGAWVGDASDWMVPRDSARAR